LLLLPQLIATANRIPEVTHLHAHFSSVATSATIIMARILGISYSFTAHGSDVLVYAPTQFALRVNEAAFTVTVSEFNRRHILEQFPTVNPDKLHVIPAGIDTALFRRPDRSPPAPGASLKLLSVARLSPEKDLDLFLRALAICRDAGVRFTYDLIGEGPERERLEAIIQETDLGQHVTLHGFKHQATIIEHLQQADLFVLVSRTEGFPVVLMEAAAVGLPILATRITAIPEIVTDGVNGLLIKPGSTAQMAQAVTSLVEADFALLTRLSAEARIRDVTRYDYRNTIQKMIKLLSHA
jgi:glycosyltransferase involved in cell wall biosynthesis